MKRSVCLLGAALFLACGGSSGLDAGFAGSWSGTSTLTLDGTPYSGTGTLNFAPPNGENVTISNICSDGSGAVTAHGTGSSASWDGTLVCPPSPVLGCSAVVFTYNHATATLASSGLSVSGTGSATGCGVTHQVALTFAGHKQGG